MSGLVSEGAAERERMFNLLSRLDEEGSLVSTEATLGQSGRVVGAPVALVSADVGELLVRARRAGLVGSATVTTPPRPDGSRRSAVTWRLTRVGAEFVRAQREEDE